jgi:hypothetical protein
MIVMHVSQITVTAFDGRGGALKGFYPLGRPYLPIFKNLGGHPPGDRVLVKRGSDRLQEP